MGQALVWAESTRELRPCPGASSRASSSLSVHPVSESESRIANLNLAQKLLCFDFQHRLLDAPRVAQPHPKATSPLNLQFAMYATRALQRGFRATPRMMRPIPVGAAQLSLVL